MSYVPAGMPEMLNRPLGSVTPVNRVPTTVTCVPGKAARAESVTVPEILPVCAAAQVGVAAARMMTLARERAAVTKLLTRDMLKSFPGGGKVRFWR